MATSEKMRFERFGRSVHLQIRSAGDCLAATALDEALWVASGAPVATVNCDETFLRLVDSDNDGRILCWELSDAIRWTTDVLADHEGVTAGSDSLTVEAVSADSPDGANIRPAVRKMLARLGRGADQAVTLADVRQFIAELQATSVSAAGVVLPEAAHSDDVRQFLADALAAVGGAPHPSGKTGLDTTRLDEFLHAAEAALESLAQGAPDGPRAGEIFPLAHATADAHEAYSSLRAKIELYFSQCQAAALDERLTTRMGLTDAELAALDMNDPAVIEQVLADAPIARPRPDGLLHYDEPTNPRDARRLDEFRRLVARPLLDDDAPTLSYSQFRKICAAFAARDAWLAEKPAESVLALGADKLRAYLDDRFAAAARKLIAESSQTALALGNIRLVEKAILYQANILDLANNFVSFPMLYDPHRRAMFELGTLVMDGRRFNLAVRVTDRAAHAAVARSANMFLMYVQVAPPAPQDGYEVAVPVTAGGKGNLCVGKRGLFCDLAGRECDARIVEIIENPISVAEALVSPFVRLGAMLSGKIESITTSAQQKFDARAQAAVDRAQAAAGGAQPAQPALPAPGRMAAGGMLMGAGVALAAVASATAYIADKLTSLHWYEIWIGIGGVVGAVAVAVMLPTFILAWLKLRKRDLSAILEGSAWAINARMRLTRKQCRVFTARPRRPDGSTLIGSRKTRRIVIAVVVAAILGLTAWLIIDRFVLDHDKPTPAADTAESAAEAATPTESDAKPTDGDGAPGSQDPTQQDQPSQDVNDQPPTDTDD